jgi:hypothetical protein
LMKDTVGFNFVLGLSSLFLFLSLGEILDSTMRDFTT